MMSELKKLLFVGLALTVSMGMVGCDDEDEGCNEAGICPDGGTGGVGGEGGTGGVGGTGGGEVLEFTTVFITDGSADENMSGTPGVDICSVQSTCGAPIGASLNKGTGDICEVDGEDCTANRANADAALSFEADCEAGSNPSHYVALGMGGQLTITFDADQAGCDLTIVEFVGNDDESYSVQVCADDGAVDCLVGDGGTTDIVSDVTGTQTFTVPAAE
jgi:hypothetical protein